MDIIKELKKSLRKDIKKFDTYLEKNPDVKKIEKEQMDKANKKPNYKKPNIPSIRK